MPRLMMFPFWTILFEIFSKSTVELQESLSSNNIASDIIRPNKGPMKIQRQRLVIFLDRIVI